MNMANRSIVVERNFTAGRLEHSPKNGKQREVDLAHDLETVLKDHLAIQQAEAALAGKQRPPWLFPSPQGEVIRSNNFRDRVWRGPY